MANDAKGKGGERKFNGLVDVYVKTLKSDGIQGLYRGFVISAVGIFVYRGMYFGIYDTLKPILIGDGGSVILSFFLGWAVTCMYNVGCSAARSTVPCTVLDFRVPSTVPSASRRRN